MTKTDALVSIAQTVLRYRTQETLKGPRHYGECLRTVTEVNDHLGIGATETERNDATNELARRYDLLG
jgi:hypothetical protein